MRNDKETMTREESIAFYKAHARRLYNTSLRIVRDSGEAEEIMQDTILKFISSEIVPKDEAQVAVWLSRTCIRKSIDAVRRKRRERLFLDEYATDASGYDSVSPVEFSGNASEAAEIRRAIDELPGNYRMILNLVLLEGLDYEEIAALTGEREGTLRTQFSRGRAKLAEKLKKMEYDRL